MTTPRLVAAASALALLTAGCSRSAPPVDLRHVPAERLVEASAAGQDRKAVLEAGARGLRINDVLVRGFAAGPPGRLRFSLDLPKDGRLFLTCAIDPRYHDRPGVEFTAKVKKDGRETVVWSQLVDPIAHPEHRGFVNAEVDLSRYAGPGRELVLEARGYEETGDPVRAFWGAPTVTSTRQRRRSWSSTSSTRCAPTTRASTATRGRRHRSSTLSRRTPSSSTPRWRTRRGRSLRSRPS